MALRGGFRLGAILARLFALASLGVMATAIALGKLNPPASGHPGKLNPPASGHRSLRPDRPVWINAQVIGDRHNSIFVDAESGLTVRMTLPEGGTLKLASGSPWQAEGGTWQVVGIWTQLQNGANDGFRMISLVRLSQPDGRILDRIDPEVYPSGPPCWSPGTSGQVLFTSTDGRLFAWDFEGPFDRETGGRQQPRPLVWLPSSSRDESVYLARQGRRVRASRSFRPVGFPHANENL